MWLKMYTDFLCFDCSPPVQTLEKSNDWILTLLLPTSLPAPILCDWVVHCQGELPPGPFPPQSKC